MQTPKQHLASRIKSQLKNLAFQGEQGSDINVWVAFVVAIGFGKEELFHLSAMDELR